MSHKAMYSSLPTIASVLAAQKGVRIIVGSEGPSTDIRAKVIYYPSYCKAIGGENERTLVEGWTDHECAHLALTDPAAGEAAQSHFEFRLANAIEDPRIEALYPKRYPGSKRILAEMIGVMAADGNFSPSTNPDPSDVVTMAVVTHLRSTLLGQALSTQAVQWGALLRMMVGASLKKEILEIAEVGAVGASAWDALSAAQKIISLLKNQGNEPEESPQHPPEQQQGEEQDSAGSDDGKDCDNTIDAAGDEGDVNTTDVSGDSEGSSPGDDSTDDDTADSPKAYVLSEQQLQTISDALESQCREGEEAIAQAISQGVGSPKRNEESAEEETILDTPNSTIPMVLSAEGDAAMRGTARRFDALLASQANVCRQTVSEGGRLRRDRLYRASCGLFDVFERRSRSEAINTAIDVVFDVSYSMGAVGIRNARETTLMLSTLLDRWDVQSHVMSFDDRITVLKDWRDSPRLMASRLLAGLHGGGTSMGAVLNVAVRALCQRQEERKIVLIVTDGNPNSPAALNAAISTAKRFGIEVRFVLIGDVDPDWFRSSCANEAAGIGKAANISSIPEAVFSAMREALSH